MRESAIMIQRDWELFKTVLKKNPNIFQEKYIDEGLFLNTYA